MVLFQSPDVTAFLAGLAASIPPGVNPYLALEAQVVPRFTPAEHSFTSQLVALLVIFSFLNILVLVSLAFKVGPNRGFWVFRVLRSSRGAYLHPHLSNAWLMSTVIFLAGLQVYITGFYLGATRKGGRAPFMTTWATAVYYPSWIGGWVAMWALSVSKASVSEPSSRASAFLSSPLFLNVHFLCVPLLFFVPLAVACATATRAFEDGNAANAMGIAGLQKLAPTWSPTSSQNDTLQLLLDTVGPPLAILFDRSDETARWIQSTWIISFVWFCYLNILISIIAYLHLKYIREHLLAPLLQGTASAGNQNRIRRSLYALALSTFCIIGIGLSFAALAGWLAFGSSGQGQNASSIIRTQALIGLWLFAFFGSAASGVFFLQGMQPSRPTATASSTPMASRKKGGQAVSSVGVIHSRDFEGASGPEVPPKFEVSVSMKTVIREGWSTDEEVGDEEKAKANRRGDLRVWI